VSRPGLSWRKDAGERAIDGVIGFASEKMMLGDLPPSSSETLTLRSAAAWAILRPVAVEPVKAILSMSG
jgi:hypothetical protein